MEHSTNTAFEIVTRFTEHCINNIFFLKIFY